MARRRRTKAEVGRIRTALHVTVAAQQPMTVRQVFYAMTVQGVVDKTEAEYKRTVARLLQEMRRSGELPYEWIADATRWMRKPATFASPGDALNAWASSYRRALWENSPVVPELWLEKDALAGVVVDVTEEWDVPLMVTRGYPSMSFTHAAAVSAFNRYEYRGQKTRIYYLGDRDPSGVDIDRALVAQMAEAFTSLDGTSAAERDGRPCCKLAAATAGKHHAKTCKRRVSWRGLDDWSAVWRQREFEKYAEIERVAVTPAQITGWGLPTRPTKASDTRSKSFKGASVELDAISAPNLRNLVEQSIRQHVNEDELENLRKVEASERQGLLRLAARHFDGEDGE
jgi:hypothetical protein